MMIHSVKIYNYHITNKKTRKHSENKKQNQLIFGIFLPMERLDHHKNSYKLISLLIIEPLTNHFSSSYMFITLLLVTGIFLKGVSL